jgi:hypothetical protein
MSADARRWRGVPRWLLAAVGLGVVACSLVFGAASPPEPVSAQARKVVEGLRTTSVYEEPGGPGIVDAQRSRDLIGDRAIVLVLLAGEIPEDRTYRTDRRADRCAEIADLVATSVVILYAFNAEGEYDAEYCVGPEFVNDANPVDGEDYVVGVVGGVNLGTHFRVTDTDKFAEVEEYVYTFDHYTMRDSPNGVPRRGVVVPPPPTPDALQAWQVALALGGIVIGTVALFVLLRAAGGLAGRRGARAEAARTRSEQVNARLNRLADTVLHPQQPRNVGDARRQADLARRYVLLLGEVESVRSPAELTAVERADTARGGQATGTCHAARTGRSLPAARPGAGTRAACARAEPGATGDRGTEVAEPATAAGRGHRAAAPLPEGRRRAGGGRRRARVVAGGRGARVGAGDAQVAGVAAAARAEAPTARRVRHGADIVNGEVAATAPATAAATSSPSWRRPPDDVGLDHPRGRAGRGRGSHPGPHRETAAGVARQR